MQRCHCKCKWGAINFRQFYLSKSNVNKDTKWTYQKKHNFHFKMNFMTILLNCIKKTANTRTKESEIIINIFMLFITIYRNVARTTKMINFDFGCQLHFIQVSRAIVFHSVLWNTLIRLLNAHTQNTSEKREHFSFPQLISSLSHLLSIRFYCYKKFC